MAGVWLSVGFYVAYFLKTKRFFKLKWMSIHWLQLPSYVCLCILPVIWWGWMAISVLWTPATTNLIVNDLWHYAKLLCIPVLAILIKQAWSDVSYPSVPTQGLGKIIRAYGWGVVVLMLPSFLDILGIWSITGWHLSPNMSYLRDSPYGLNLVYWRNQIVHGFEVTLLFVFICYLPLWQKYPALNKFLMLAVMTDVIFLIIGRAAFLGLTIYVFSMAILFFAQQLRCWRNSLSLTSPNLFTMLGALVFLFIGVVSSSALKARLASLWFQTHDFWLSTPGHLSTSNGQRLHYWQLSLGLWERNPWLGAGVGSFRWTLEATKDPMIVYNHFHSHNEYIIQLSQFGLIGLGFLIVYAIFYWKTIRFMTFSAWRWIAGGVLWVFAINAFSDASLHNLWEGWSLVLFTAWLAVAASQRDIKQNV
jgi:hypothetical protein